MPRILLTVIMENQNLLAEIDPEMENNQIMEVTGSAPGAINLQDTIQIPAEIQNENLNDSLLDLSEVQLQTRLDTRTNGPDFEGGNEQNPPTHTDYEKSKHPQSPRSTEARTVPRVRRELQSLGSYNNLGTEEMPTEQTGRRRRSVPIQTLQAKFDFYEQEANSPELYLPQVRSRGDDR